MQKRDRCMDNHNSRRSFGYALPVWEQQHEDPNARRQVSRICNSPALCHGKLWCRLFAPKLMEHDYIYTYVWQTISHMNIHDIHGNPFI